MALQRWRGRRPRELGDHTSAHSTDSTNTMNHPIWDVWGGRGEGGGELRAGFNQITDLTIHCTTAYLPALVHHWREGWGHIRGGRGRFKGTWGCTEGGGGEVILLVVAVSRASLSVLSVEAGHLQQ